MRCIVGTAVCAIGLLLLSGCRTTYGTLFASPRASDPIVHVESFQWPNRGIAPKAVWALRIEDEQTWWLWADVHSRSSNETRAILVFDATGTLIETRRPTAAEFRSLRLLSPVRLQTPDSRFRQTFSLREPPAASIGQAIRPEVDMQSSCMQPRSRSTGPRKTPDGFVVTQLASNETRQWQIERGGMVPASLDPMWHLGNAGNLLGSTVWFFWTVRERLAAVPFGHAPRSPWSTTYQTKLVNPSQVRVTYPRESADDDRLERVVYRIRGGFPDAEFGVSASADAPLMYAYSTASNKAALIIPDEQ